jgi:hypothetical protein
MLGKNSAHLLRLSGVLYHINLAFEFLRMRVDLVKKGITQEVESELKTYLDSRDVTTVNKKSIIQAQKIVDFYNKGFLILAGYDIEIDEPVETFLKRLAAPKIVANSDKKIEDSIKKIIRLVLLSPSLRTDSGYLRKQHKINRPDALEAFLAMEEIGFGKITENKAYGPICFLKLTEQEVKHDLTISVMFDEFGVSLKTYFSKINEISGGKPKKKTGKLIFENILTIN